MSPQSISNKERIQNEEQEWQSGWVLLFSTELSRLRSTDDRRGRQVLGRIPAEQPAQPVTAHQVLWRRMRRLDKCSQLELPYVIHLCQTAVQTLKSQPQREAELRSPFFQVAVHRTDEGLPGFYISIQWSWICLSLAIQKDHTTNVSSPSCLNMWITQHWSSYYHCFKYTCTMQM